MSIKVNLNGWEDLLEAVKDAEGDLNGVARRCIEKSAAIMQEELKKAMIAADAKSENPGGTARLASRMPGYKIDSGANTFTAHVGFEGGTFDPENPSDYYKAAFINYGTPRIEPRKFIDAAKKSAKKRIAQEQEKALAEMTRGLTK